MKLAITLARTGTNWTVLSGPEVGVQEQSQKFKQLKVELVGMVDEIQLWTSSQGRTKRYKFRSQTEAAVDEDSSEDSSPAPVITSESSPAPVSDDLFAGLTGLALHNAKRKAAKVAAKAAVPAPSPAKGKKPAKKAVSAAQKA